MRPLARATPARDTGALAASDRALLARCDGRHSLLEIAARTRAREVDEASHLVALTEHLLRLEQQGLLDRSAAPRRPVRFVLGLEDAPQFVWQLAILLESFHGQLPPGWSFEPVVCNGHATLSRPLRRVLDTYGVHARTGDACGRAQPLELGLGPEDHPALHRIEALRVAGASALDDELVCLLDTDQFLYREIDLDAFPDDTALVANPLIDQPRFFATPEGHPGAVDLHALAAAAGSAQPFLPGGVVVFLAGAVARNEKLVRDCFRFAQVLVLLGRIGGGEKLWHAEMPVYALALTANGIPYAVVDPAGDRFVITRRRSLAAGALYHYYADRADGGVDGAFAQSRWCKQAWRDRDLFEADLDALERGAASDPERFFFQLARRARLRLARAEPPPSAQATKG